MQKLIFKRILIPLFTIVIVVSGTVGAPKVSQHLQEFKNSKSAHSKVQIIRSLVKEQALISTNASEMESAAKIISSGLNDRNALVVQEAIFAAGNFRNKNVAPELYELYKNGYKAFPGNQSIIKQKIIRAYGKIGGNETEHLFIEELNSKTICYETVLILSSLLENGKCSPKIVESVAALRNAIEYILKGVEDSPENSIRYSQHRTILALANSLITKNTQTR